MLWTKIWNGKTCSSTRPVSPAPAERTLADIQPGAQAHLVDFSASLPAERWAHLQAYGLVPGRLVHVIQRSPVIVIRVEHTELAMEEELARQIHVTRA